MEQYEIAANLLAGKTCSTCIHCLAGKHCGQGRGKVKATFLPKFGTCKFWSDGKTSPEENKQFFNALKHYIDTFGVNL